MNAEEKQKLIKDLKISIGESDNRRAFVLVQRGILMDALEIITEHVADTGGVIVSGKQMVIGSDYSSEQIVSECACSEREV